jgi:mycothiol synthase
MTRAPLTTEHIPAAVEVANAIAAADDSGAYVIPADLADALASSADSLGVWLDDRLVGYGLVSASEGAVTIKGGIHPDFRRRGLGGQLLDWQLQHAEAIDVEVEETNAGALLLMASRGFQPIRSYRVMRRWYDDRPVPTSPSELPVIEFDPQYDERLRLTYNEVFTGQGDFEPRNADHWAKWFTGHHAFRATMSRLVVDGDRVVAFALGYEFTVDTEQTGVRELWVGQVGALREYRGRGLARAALSAVLRAGQDAGYQRSQLGVDADNPTGASRLYESLGYVTFSNKVSLVRRSPTG